jgi:hypothetical protein
VAPGETEPDLGELTGLLDRERHLHHPDLCPLHPLARLRVHPKVLNELLKRYVIDGLLDIPVGDFRTIMGIPVTVDATMEPGTWQFVIGEGKI